MNNYSRINLEFKKGKGSILYDFKGKKYIDFASGIGVCSLGHGDGDLAKSITKQAKKILHISNLYKIRLQEKLANKISTLLNVPYYLFFANSGAEANECAIKLARKYGNSFSEKKDEIITLANSFHGRTIATLKLTGQEKFHSKDFSPYPDAFKFFNSINEIIENLNDKTVAVMLELVQGEGGINPLNKNEIKKLAEILRERKILLITDEVQCGVYRTGSFVASQFYEIVPDIITFAKGLGGGISIGACASREDIFCPGDHGSTFGGNFIACSASLCVLKKLEKLKKTGKIDKNIALFIENLDNIVKKFPNLFLKRVGLGLMQGLVLKNHENLDRIFKKALENRLLILKSGNDTLRFLPPLNIDKVSTKKGFKRFKKSLNSKEIK